MYVCVLVSGVQQSDSVIHTYLFFFGFFSITGYYKISSIVPGANIVGPCWLSILYIVVYLLIPNS